MSQIHYSSVSLEELVAMSDCILHVRKCEPFMVTENISIRRMIKRYPPFAKIVHSYTIVDILRSTADVKRDSEIKVIQANYSQKLELHKKYYIESISKSPIYQEYSPELDSINENEHLVFLHFNQKQKSYEYSTESSFESLSKKSRVLELLNEK